MLLVRYMQSQQHSKLELLGSTSTDTNSTAENIQAMLQAVYPHLERLPNMDTEITRLPDTIETAIVSRLEHDGHQLDHFKREIKEEFHSCALQQRSELQEVVSIDAMLWMKSSESNNSSASRNC